MKQYMFSLQNDADIERISDDIYGQDILETASSVFLQLFGPEDNRNLLSRLIDSLKEKYPEVTVAGAFAATKAIEGATLRTELSMVVLDDADIDSVVSVSPGMSSKTKRDLLTGVLARTEIEHLFEEYLIQSQTLRPALVMVDIDKLDQINVNLGHDAGDYVLKTVTGVLENVLRDTDKVGRWESEKFMILLKDVDTDGSALIAERLRQAVEDESFADIDRVTISLGVTLIGSGESKEAVFERADTALRHAKENGRNCFEVQ